MYRIITAIMLTVIAINVAGCSGYKAGLGRKISDSKIMFDGDLEVRAFKGGLVLSLKDGSKTTIHLSTGETHTPPYGDIGVFYADREQAELLGEPLEGEYLVFNDRYRIHIFTGGVAVWNSTDRSIQTLICNEPFNP